MTKEEGGRRVLHINSVPYGSTCRVMLGIARSARAQGICCDTASGFSTHPVPGLPEAHYPIGGFFSKALHIALARATGLNGCFSTLATLGLIRHIRRSGYQLLHLHNLHGWYLNIPLLMRYVRRRRIPVVWTLHDCWAFTGQCPHYAAIGCQRWRAQCFACPQTRLYPQSLVDLSRLMYRWKKRWFASLPDVTLAVPSEWLSTQVRQSFLRHFPVQVIPNGIDLTVFKPAAQARQGGACIVLGVCDGWTKRKGLDVFIQLAGRLKDGYQIVLVGTDERVEALVPPNIRCVRRTGCAAELAGYYAAADVFVNPSLEDTFPAVNLEALACGTPVVAFEACGNAEALDDRCGIAVPAGDVDALEKAIRLVCTRRPFAAADCVRRARRFDQRAAYEPYVDLYRQKAGNRP